MIIKCEGKEYLIPNKIVELYEETYMPIAKLKQAPALLHQDMIFIKKLLELNQ